MDTPAAPAPAAETPAATPTATEVVAQLSDEQVAKLAEGIEGPEETTPTGEKPPEGDKPAEAVPVTDKPKAADEAMKLRRMGAKLARRHEAITRREGELTAAQQRAAVADRLVTLARTDKLAALKELGIEPDEIVDAVLARQAGAKPATAEDRMAKLEKELQAERQARAASEQAANNQRAYDNFHRDVVAKIEAAPGLEHVKSGKLYDDVIANMGAYHARHGVLPDPVVVAKYVEATARALEDIEKGSPATGTPKKNPPPSTGQTKKTTAASPSLTDRISDTPTGDDELPEDPDERLKVIWNRHYA